MQRLDDRERREQHILTCEILDPGTENILVYTSCPGRETNSPAANSEATSYISTRYMSEKTEVVVERAIGEWVKMEQKSFDAVEILSINAAGISRGPRTCSGPLQQT